MKQNQETSSHDPLDMFVRDKDPLLIRGEIYNVPPDFFDKEKQRIISEMHREAGCYRKKVMRHKVMRWSAAAAAACLLVAVSVSATLMFTSPEADKIVSTPVPAANSTAVQYHSGDIADNSNRPATGSEWTRSDETESADILLWLY